MSCIILVLCFMSLRTIFVKVVNICTDILCKVIWAADDSCVRLSSCKFYGWMNSKARLSSSSVYSMFERSQKMGTSSAADLVIVSHPNFCHWFVSDRQHILEHRAPGTWVLLPARPLA